MTLTEILTLLPDEYKPWAIKYAPSLLRTGGQGIVEWLIYYGAKGEMAAYKMVIQNMTDDEIAIEMGLLADANQDATSQALARASFVCKALSAIAGIVLDKVLL